MEGAGLYAPSIAPFLLSLAFSCCWLLNSPHLPVPKERQQSATHAVWSELAQQMHTPNGICLPMQVQKQDLNNAALLGQVQTESSQYL